MVKCHLVLLKCGLCSPLLCCPGLDEAQSDRSGSFYIGADHMLCKTSIKRYHFLYVAKDEDEGLHTRISARLGNPSLYDRLCSLHESVNVV